MNRLHLHSDGKYIINLSYGWITPYNTKVSNDFFAVNQSLL